MNNTILSTAFITAIILISCSSSRQVGGNASQQITVKNNSSVQLVDKPVSTTRSSFKNIPAGNVYPVLLSNNKDTVPSQLDDVNGDSIWDELFFVINLSPNAQNNYSLTWTDLKPVYKTRTSARFGKRMTATEQVKPATSDVVLQRDLPRSIGFQRYQTDGPSWENDKVGFRHYLDGRNSKDVFGKLVTDMSPETVGINAQGGVVDNYHVMANWGRDILAVGNSIGMGGIALIEGNQLMRLGVTVDDAVNNIEKTTFNIATEGPVRSMLHFNYNNWKPLEGKTYSVIETTSIWPGMYAFHNQVNVNGLTGNERLGIGMVNINSTKQPTEVRVGDKWIALVNHDKHTYNKEWWLGLALIVPASIYDGYIDAPKTGKLSNTFLAKLKVQNNQPVQYYSVAGWELSDPGFKDEAYFKKYVEDFIKQLSANVSITVK